MLTSATGPLLHPEAQNNSEYLRPVPESERRFPVNRDHPTTITDNEVQVAGLSWAAGRAASIVGRVLRPTDDSLGNSYNRLLELRAKKEAEKLGKDPALVARDALVPTRPNEIRPRTLGTGEPPPAATTRVVDAVDEAYMPGVVDEMNTTDGYKRWLTFGDDELDAIMKGALRDPRVDDGVIAGIRVKGTTPGMEVKVPDEGHIHGIIQSTGDAVAKKLAGKSDDELKDIGFKQTVGMANLIGMSPEKLLRTFAGGRFNLGRAAPGELAATVVAGKNLLVTEIRKLDELADKAAISGSDADRWAWKRQAELVANIQANFKGVQTDIARALSAMRIPAGDSVAMTRDFGRMLDEWGGSSNIAAQIDAYRNLPDAAQRLHATRQLSVSGKALDTIHDIWVNSMLSGWFTHVKNTAGVVGAMVWDLGEGSLTATRQLHRPLFGKQRDVTFGDVQAKVFGQMMSMREAIKAGGKGFWLREDALQGGGEMSLITGHGNPFRANGFSAEAWGAKGNWGTVVDYMGHLVTMGRAPTRALMAEDAFMKTVSYRGSLYEQAYRAARQENLKGDDFSEFIAEFLLEPPREARDIAVEQAKYVTLQTDMQGALKQLQKFSSNRFMRMLVPFYKTPTNALLYVFERMPLGVSFGKQTDGVPKYVFGMKRYKDAIEQGGAAAANANTRMIMGSALMLTLYQNWEAGDFTGGLSPDPRIRKTYERMGVKPYHFRIGNTYYNYGMLEPISTIIGVIADAQEVIHHPDTDDMTREQVFFATAGVIGYNLTNKSFMSGIQMFMDATRNPGRFGPRFFENYARSFIPGSSALNEITKATDELKRFRGEFLDKIAARLPGLSKDLPPRYDLWGRPEYHGSRWSSPYKPNAVDKEFVRIGLGINKHPEVISVGAGIDPINLDYDEIAFLHKTAGENAFKMLNMLITKPTQFEREYKLTIADDYKKFLKASKAGDELATDSLKEIYRRVLNVARLEAQDKLFNHPVFGEGLEAMKRDLINEKRAKINALKEATR